MRKSLTTLLALVIAGSSFSFAQFQDPDHYYLTDVKVFYYNYLRDSTANPSWAGGNDTTLSADWDSSYATAVQAHWPTKAYAQAGYGYSHDLLAADSLGHHFHTIETDDSLLTTESLENYGVMLHIQINADGSSAIPPTGYEATYPTFRDTLCITIPTVPTVDDAPTLDWTGPEETTDGDLYGWGVLNSDVFDWFDALEYDATTGTIDTANKPNNWGSVLAHYDATGTAYDSLTFEWSAMDGRWQDGGSDSGYDDDSTSSTHGDLNRILGVRMTGDTSTIAASAYALTLMQAGGLADTSIEAINVSTTYPMIGGSGQADDADGDGDADDIILPTALGGTLTHGYLFNPTGDDDVLFSGDEALAYTGYYFTKNFLDAAGGFGTAFAVAMATSPTAGDSAWFYAGLDSVFREFGIAAAYSAAYAAGAASTMHALVTAAVTAGAAYTDAVGDVAAAGPVYALGTLAGQGHDTNDSGYDYSATDTVNTHGRLVFELDDTPVCLPIYQTRSVQGTFVKYSLLEVDSDLSNVPMKFEVHNNYPNPFNPVTTIRFDLPEANRTKVTVWNILGQHVNTLYIGDLQAGSHKLHFNGLDRSGQALSSGVYFYKVESGPFHATKKMMLLK